ncbi:SGNH/GDSL hydrolase family protein [Blastococcus sp. SYSU DS0533]
MSTTGADRTPRDGASWTSPPLPRGTHTATLANTSGRTVLVEGISVYDGDEAAGVRLWEAGPLRMAGRGLRIPPHRAAARAGGRRRGAAPGGGRLGYNDVVAGFSAADFRGSLTTTIAHLLGPDAGPDPSVLVVGYPPSTDVPAAAWEEYIRAMSGVAAEQGYAFADLSALPDFGMSGDGVQPTTSGHAQIAAALDRFLAAG